MQAYGASVDADLIKAAQALLSRRGRIERCIEALRMTTPPAQLRQRVKALLPRQRAAAAKQK